MDLSRACCLTNLFVSSGFMDKYSWVSSAQQWKCMQFFLVVPKGSMYYAKRSQHRYQWSMEIYIFIFKKKKKGWNSMTNFCVWRRLLIYIYTNWNLSDGYNSKPCSTFPLTLMVCLNLCSKMLWSRIANAALRASRARIANSTFPILFQWYDEH